MVDMMRRDTTLDHLRGTFRNVALMFNIQCMVLLNKMGLRRGEIALFVKPSTRHSVSSEGVIIFLFYFYKLITFKLVQSYNVKRLTCTISCSSGLQNIYKLHTWNCSIFTIFTLLHLFTNNKKDITYTK